MVQFTMHALSDPCLLVVRVRWRRIGLSFLKDGVESPAYANAPRNDAFYCSPKLLPKLLYPSTAHFDMDLSLLNTYPLSTSENAPWASWPPFCRKHIRNAHRVVLYSLS